MGTVPSIIYSGTSTEKKPAGLMIRNESLAPVINGTTGVDLYESDSVIAADLSYLLKVGRPLR